MQAEVGGERRRRRIIILIAVLLAVVAAVGTYSLSTRPGGGPAASAVPRTIVIAATDIKSRTQITAEMLRTTSVPDNPAFATVISDPTLAVGMTAIVDVVTGEPIRPSMYGTGNPAGVTILAPGETVGPDSPVWRAVSISVPSDRAVGGLINPGDHVDVVVTLNPQLYDPTGGKCLTPVALPCAQDPDRDPPLFGEVYSDPTTKVTLTNVEVLTTEPDTNLYVLKVDERQAEQIAHIQSSGENSFTLSLRPQADVRELDRPLYGQTTNSLINEFGFPIPLFINVTAGASPGTVPIPGPIVSPTPEPTP